MPDLGLELAPIPAGTFKMGSPPDEADRDENEGPQTEVTLSLGFWLGKNVVTQGEWTAIMSTTIDQQREKAARQVAAGRRAELSRLFCLLGRGDGVLPQTDGEGEGGGPAARWV